MESKSSSFVPNGKISEKVGTEDEKANQPGAVVHPEFSFDKENENATQTPKHGQQFMEEDSKTNYETSETYKQMGHSFNGMKVSSSYNNETTYDSNFAVRSAEELYSEVVDEGDSTNQIEFKRQRKKRRKSEEDDDEDFVPAARPSRNLSSAVPRQYCANNYRGYDPITGMPQSNTARAAAYLGPPTDGYADYSHVKGVYKNCRGIWAAQWTDEKGQRHTKYFNPKFYPTENEARVSALKFKHLLMQEMEMKGGNRKSRASRTPRDTTAQHYGYMYGQNRNGYSGYSSYDAATYYNIMRQQPAAYQMSWASMAAAAMHQNVETASPLAPAKEEEQSPETIVTGDEQGCPEDASFAADDK